MESVLMAQGKNKRVLTKRARKVEKGFPAVFGGEKPARRAGRQIPPI
jgi:hypothetical protein